MTGVQLLYKKLWEAHPRSCQKIFRNSKVGVPRRGFLRDITTSNCGQPAVIVASWTQYRRGVPSDRSLYLCNKHAVEFAKRHDLELRIPTDVPALQIYAKAKEEILGFEPTPERLRELIESDAYFDLGA